MGSLEGGDFIMVNFYDLSSLGANATIGDFLALPNSAYPYFWAWIIGALWIILSLSLYFKEKETNGKGKILGAMAVSSLAMMILSLVGTILGIITQDIILYILVIGFVIIGIWFFKK